MQKTLVGVMGGSGLYAMEALANATEHQIETPFGKPSDVIVTGQVAGVEVAFLARHGRGHRLIPSEVPYRANIYAFKSLGVRYLISMSAVGSLAEEMKPLDMVLPDLFIDMTKRRDSTFFGHGAVAHVSMAQPVCASLSDVLARAVKAANMPSNEVAVLSKIKKWVEALLGVPGRAIETIPRSCFTGLGSSGTLRLARSASLASHFSLVERLPP